MPKNGTVAYTNRLPACNFHDACTAEYDFKTKMGPWANGCQEAWEDNRMFEELGIGKGQKLEARPDLVGRVVTPR